MAICWSPVINKIWQKGQDVTSGIRLQKTVISVLLSPVLIACLFWRSKPPHFELPYGEDYVARNWGRPLANNQWETQALQTYEANGKLKAANDQINGLGNKSSTSWALSWLQSWPTLWFQPHKRLWARGPSWALHRFLTHTNCAIIHVNCSKLLHSKAICCAAIDN